MSIKANCIDSTAAPEQVFAREVQKMKEERIKVGSSDTGIEVRKDLIIMNATADRAAYVGTFRKVGPIGIVHHYCTSTDTGAGIIALSLESIHARLRCSQKEVASGCWRYCIMFDEKAL